MIVGGTKYVLHLVPSGILRPKKKCVIGNGVVIDPARLLDKLQMHTNAELMRYAIENRLVDS